MNREIKFRAWLVEDKKMATYISHAKLGSDGFFQISVPWDESGIHDYQVPSQAVLMQYTGLKDKNGKEIYEGDICSYSQGDDYSKQYRTVVFDDGMFVLSLDRLYIHDGVVEVIGNIYENPELLK